MKKLYRAAHKYLLKHPSAGEALQEVKRLTVAEFPDMAKAATLRQAQTLLQAGIQERIMPMIRNMDAPLDRDGVPPDDYKPDITTSLPLMLGLGIDRADIRNARRQEITCQTAIFLAQKQTVARAKALLRAFLDDKRGRKRGYQVYLKDAAFSRLDVA